LASGLRLPARRAAAQADRVALAAVDHLREAVDREVEVLEVVAADLGRAD
jgi:hypothetical protein